MFHALANYLTDTADRAVSKDAVLANTNATLTSIHKEVLPVMHEVLKSKEFFKSDKINVLLHVGSGLGISTSDPTNVIKELIKFFKSVEHSGRALTALIESDFGSRVFHSTATAQEAAIMKTVSDITSATLYAIDLMYLVTIDSNTELPKKKLEDLNDGVSYFIGIVNVYKDNFDKHVVKLSKVAKVHIDKSAGAGLMDKLFANHGEMVALPMFNGFIHNPVYHVRMWLVDQDVSKLESLKQKKKLLETKLLELKMAGSGKHDERLSKQVTYYEDKVSDIENDIRDIEE